MEERIKKTQAELERCGEEGLVDEAQDLNKQVESMQMDLVNLRAVRHSRLSDDFWCR